MLLFIHNSGLHGTQKVVIVQFAKGWKNIGDYEIKHTGLIMRPMRSVVEDDMDWITLQEGRVG